MLLHYSKSYVLKWRYYYYFNIDSCRWIQMKFISINWHTYINSFLDDFQIVPVQTFRAMTQASSGKAAITNSTWTSHGNQRNTNVFPYLDCSYSEALEAELYSFEDYCPGPVPSGAEPHIYSIMEDTWATLDYSLIPNQ